MGGIGSGRWADYTKRRTVEECATVAISELLPSLREGWGGGNILVPGGFLRWALRDECTTLVIAGRREARIRLAVRRLSTGVLRWFMVCPGCGAQCQKLYLPHSVYRTSWACRACHSLTYTTSQERRKPSKAMRELLASIDRDEAALMVRYRRLYQRSKAT